MMAAYLKKNQSKSPLLVATYKYHQEMARMIWPDIPCIYIHYSKFYVKPQNFKIKNFRFFMIYAYSYFLNVAKIIKENPNYSENSFTSLTNYIGLKREELIVKKTEVPQDVEESMLNNIKSTGLNLNNFIFIAPEAKTLKYYNNEFWKNLINKFKSQGYDIFINICDKNLFDFGNIEYKTYDLSYSECFALAKHSKKIITLRSGLTEFLLHTGVDMYIIFPPRENLAKTEISYKMHGLYNFPRDYTGKINEIKILPGCTNDDLQKIIEEITN